MYLSLPELHGDASVSTGHFVNPTEPRHSSTTTIRVGPFLPELFSFMEYLIGEAGYQAKVSSESIDLVDPTVAEKVFGPIKKWEENKIYYFDGRGVGEPTKQSFFLHSLNPEPHVQARSLVLSLATQGAKDWVPDKGGLLMSGSVPFSEYKNQELIDTFNSLHDGIFEIDYIGELNVNPENFAELIQETTNFVLPLAYTNLSNGGVSWYVEAIDGEFWISADADEGVGVKKIEKMFENCGVEKAAIQTYE